MTMSKLSICLTLIAAALLAGCGKEPTQTITLSGSSTIAPLMVDIGKRFEAGHPGIRVDVQAGGTSRGIQDARSGLAAIGMASRSLDTNESDLTPYLIAKDGIAMIVHRDNPLNDISSEQVVNLYTRKTVNWSELGATPGPVVLVHKAEGRSTLELFLKHFKLNNDDIKPDLVIGDNQQGIKSVAGNPLAIGYVSIGSAEYESQHGVAIKLLSLDGKQASTEALLDGRYPLKRDLNLVIRGNPSANVKALLEFSQSSEVADLVAEHYFITATKR
ncbi:MULTISPECIES: phosphate ABC transporter substrate-binding protein [Pseudomonas]|jgi:phosphate transport system substrate-binding protein|uniref:Phosphate ABC transporter substrate-binding protein n=2 Tax=Pseudomonas TaxID=286 RepID=A0A7X1L0L0_9PSED|nr:MULTISPECIES: phosphate ABC transporter substrate-binding protein [Pseudomonas]KRP86572.1 ABC transporter substrate-binding protein [Pseudomonas lactis]MBC2693580.1 phosphate ABC transporter substrate-binding protein [Pseudomonas kielensis]MDD1010317.1 phosphate ABC transporter substrate-binding protein [Pseudomonas shahriarae]